MDAFDNSYSRFVALAKIALPLIALGILSTLFLLARTYDPERAIPYADVDVDRLIREERLSSPTFSSVTSDGAALTMSAEVVQPDRSSEDRVLASGVKARLDLPDGEIAAMNAPRAAVDNAAGQMALSGGVYMETSSGYRLGTQELVALLDRTDIRSAGEVSGDAPAGRLTAGSMRLTEDEAGGYLLVFNDGVRLVYQPPNPEE